MTDIELAQDEAALRRRRGDYDPEQVRLIKATVAEGATDAELAMFLELAARYGLDPFAHEIWCAPQPRKDGSRGRMLIMVGRDGLRKVARRLKAKVDRDVVREQDEFEVERLPDGRRAITHRYKGSQGKRGAIVGAWCEVDAGPEAYGFFYAPLEEYLPTSEAKLKYSPWGSQRSVMILAAAERTALAMASNLSGVVVEGEMDLNEERAAGEVALAVDIAWPSADARARLEPLFAAINALAPHSYGPGAIDLLVRGQAEEALAALASRLEEERGALVASAAQNGEVVEGAAEVPDAPEEPQDDAPQDAEVVEPEAPEAPPEPPAPVPEDSPEPAERGSSALSALFAGQEAQAGPAPGEPQTELPREPEPEIDPTAPGVDPEPEPEEAPPAEPEEEDPDAPTELPPLEPTPSVPAASVEDLRADLAYWLDVKADPEYRDQQGMSEDEVEANISELRAAIDAQEPQG